MLLSDIMFNFTAAHVNCKLHDMTEYNTIGKRPRLCEMSAVQHANIVAYFLGVPGIMPSGFTQRPDQFACTGFTA